MHNRSIINRQAGATLLEVLIAILVLSFGLLGMLGMITNGLKMTSSSNYRTIAAQQLTAMADMINANPSLITAYAALTNTATANCLKTTGCSTAQLPNNDYSLWLSNLSTIVTNQAQMLPSGAGIVCLDDSPSDGNSSDFHCSNTGRLTVKICWNENSRIAISRGGVSGSDSSTDTCLSSQL